MCKANMAGIPNGMVCVHTFWEWEGKGWEWEQREIGGNLFLIQEQAFQGACAVNNSCEVCLNRLETLDGVH